MCLSPPLCLRLCLNVLCTSACHFLLCCGFSLFLHSPSFSSSLRVPVHYIPFLGGCKLNLFSCWTPHLRCPLSSLTGGLTSNEQPLELLKPATLNHFGRKHICVCVCLSVRTIFGLMALWFFSLDLCDINVISVKQSAKTTRKQVAKIHFADCCTLIWVKNSRHVFHLVLTPVATLVLPYAELSDRCSHVFGFTHLQLTTCHYRTSMLSWRCGDTSVASAGWCTAQEHAPSVAVYEGTCHYLPEHVIISTGWRRTLFLAHGDVLFSGRLLLESALAHASAHVRVCESRHFAGTSHSCWQERGMIAPHQHAINPQAVCLSHVASGNADAAVMSPVWLPRSGALAC